MARLDFQPQAIEDIKQISPFIASDSKANAHSIVSSLEQACLLRSRLPHSGRPREELHPGLRSFTHGEYVVFYLVMKQGIRIVRVLHGRRDIFSVFS